MLKKIKKKIFYNYIFKTVSFLNMKKNFETDSIIFVHYLAKKKVENNYLFLEEYKEVLDDFLNEYTKELQLILLKKQSVLLSIIDSELFLEIFNEISKPFFNELSNFLDQQFHQANCWLEEINQEIYPFYWEKVN